MPQSVESEVRSVVKFQKLCIPLRILHDAPTTDLNLFFEESG